MRLTVMIGSSVAAAAVAASPAASQAVAPAPGWALKEIALGSSMDDFKHRFADAQCTGYRDPKIMSCKANSTLAGGPIIVEVKFLDAKAVWVALEDLTLDQGKSAQQGLMDKFGPPTSSKTIDIMDRRQYPAMFAKVYFEQAIWAQGDVEMKMYPDWQLRKPSIVSAVILWNHHLYEGDWWVRFQQNTSSASDI